MAAQIFEGSCICGSVSYRITGEPRSFFHCHCRRCRKASGTGHASNVIIRPDRVEWISGEALLRSYRVPDAARFRTVFCEQCGSPMPRIYEESGIAVIPAGSLDHEPPLTPTDHIMWSFRAAWSCDAGEIPKWPEYPG